MGFGKDGKGQIIKERTVITVGNLGATVVVKSAGGIEGSLGEDFRILKTEYFIVQTGEWGALGDQVIIGMADNELSVAEIAENLNLDGPIDRNDNLLNERVFRPVWMFNHLLGTSTVILEEPTDDGNALVQNVKWTFSNPEGWVWFAYNPLLAALTAGATFIIQAKHFGVWVT